MTFLAFHQAVEIVHPANPKGRYRSPRMITLVLFFLLLMAGLPIIFLLIFASFSFLVEVDAMVLVDSFAVQSVRGIEANGFLAIPLYMLVGEIMNRGRITERLVRSALRLVGGLRGGLAYVNVLTNAFAAAILGSATAQIAIMTRSLVPEMEKQGYDKGFATGLSVVSGLLGPIIPPSMLMIIYGVLAYQSVAALFIAGLIPGILIAAAPLRHRRPVAQLSAGHRGGRRRCPRAGATFCTTRSPQ